MRSAAVFMLVLIVLIPVNTSLALGQSFITDVQVSGTDMIPGVMRTYDYTIVSAKVKVDGSLNAANVKYGDKDSTISFNQCVGTPGDFYTCEYSSSQQVSMAGGGYQYMITVVDDSGEKLASHTGSIVVDGRSPEVTSIVADAMYGKDNISIGFTAKDFAGAYGASCAGLEKIELRLGESTIATESIEGCSDSGTITIPYTKIGQSGDYQLCLVAIDILDQKSDSRCTWIALDITSPRVISSVLRNAELDRITYATGGRIVFEINITEDTSLGARDVKAKFLEIHSSWPGYVSADSCDKSGQIYTCRWSVPYDINQTGSYNIPVMITDSMGNTLDSQVTQTIMIDNSRPYVNWMQSEIMHQGISYLREVNNTIIASISETGSGISKEKVFLILDTMTGESRRPATECLGSACYWSGVDATFPEQGPKYLSIAPDSHDNSNNRFIISNATEFIIIKQKPQIHYSNWTALGKFSDYNLSYAVEGDRVLFNFTLYSISPTMDASADFRDFGDRESFGSCTANDTLWYCEFSVVLNSSGQKTAYFTFTDIVGNQETSEYTLDIKYEENRSESNWDYRILSVSPSKIDRQTTTLINHKVYTNVEFIPKTGVIGEGIDLIGCLALENKSTLIRDVDRLATAQNKEWLKTILQSAKFNGTDKIDLVCSHRMISLVDDKYVHQELLNITYRIEFYNMPLGELSDSVQNEIDRVNQSWLVRQEWLDTAYKLLRMYDTLCRVVDMIENIRLILCAMRDLTCPIVTTDQPATLFGKMCSKTTGVEKSTWAGVKRFCNANSCLVLALLDSKDSTEGSSTSANSASNNIRDFFKTFYGSADFMEESLPLSMLFVCLKGLIRNLQKARMIECQYIQCLNSEVRSGKPIQICTMTRGYMQCKWIYGQLFNLLPFASVFGKFAESIDRALTDPITAVNMAAGFVCGYVCQTPKVCGACSTCTIISILNMLVNLYKDLEQMSDNDYSSFDIGDTVCQDVLGT